MYENQLRLSLKAFLLVLNIPKCKGPYHTAEQLIQLHGTLTPGPYAPAIRS